MSTRIARWRGNPSRSSFLLGAGVQVEEVRGTERKCEKCGKVKLMRYFPLARPDNPFSYERIKKCSVCAKAAHAKARRFEEFTYKEFEEHARKKKENSLPNIVRVRRRQKHRMRRIKQATPPWANMGAILNIYRCAKKTTKTTGIPHEVDHIIPIIHKNVCGLHVETNLRIITAEENKRKRNKFIPELLDGPSKFMP